MSRRSYGGGGSSANGQGKGDGSSNYSDSRGTNLDRHVAGHQPTGTVIKPKPETVWVDVGNGQQLASLADYLSAVKGGGIGPAAGAVATPQASAVKGPGAAGKAPAPVAQVTKGPAVVVTGKPSGGTAGPGAAVVTTAKPKAQPTTGKPPGKPMNIGVGPGNPFVGPAPLTPGKKDKATGGYAGFEIHPNPYFSNVEDFWETRYGEPGEWIGGILNVGADLIYNAPGAINSMGINPSTPGLGADWYSERAGQVKPPDPQEEVDWGWN